MAGARIGVHDAALYTGVIATRSRAAETGSSPDRNCRACYRSFVYMCAEEGRGIDSRNEQPVVSSSRDRPDIFALGVSGT